MNLRGLAVSVVAGVPLTVFASTITQRLVGADPNLRALNLTTVVPLHNGLFIAAGATVSGSAQVRGVLVGQSGGGFSSFLGLDGHSEAGGSAFLSGDSWAFISSMSGTSGHLWSMNRNSGFLSSMTTVWNPAGPTHPISDGVSVDGSRNVNALFEVRPTTLAPRIALVVTLPLGQFSGKLVHTYPLEAGAQILDCAQRPDGGLVYLSGTPTMASVNVIDADGTRNGPYFVGAASEIAYSPVNGGTVFTAGTAGPDALFTRGPVNGTFADSKMEPFPFTNLGFEFDASFTRADGTCWWGGSYTTLAGDQDGFIGATENTAQLTFFGANATPSTSSDEVVRDISIDPYGRGIWAGDGQLGVFNAATGQTIQVHPASPSPTVQYKSVVNQPFNASSPIPYSNFGIVGFDTVAQRSVFVLVTREGDLLKASTPMSSYVGGTSPSLTVQLYKKRGNPGISYSASSSNPAVTVPGTLAFASDERVKALSLATQPVATAQDVVITVGTTDAAQAHFTLLPPTPKLFTPASHTVRGGNNVVSSLTLTGKTPATGITIALSDNGSELSTDPTMYMPAGLYSKSFLIRTIRVVSTITRTVTATYAGVSKTTDITINP